MMNTTTLPPVGADYLEREAQADDLWATRKKLLSRANALWLKFNNEPLEPAEYARVKAEWARVSGEALAADERAMAAIGGLCDG